MRKKELIKENEELKESIRCLQKRIIKLEMENIHLSDTSKDAYKVLKMVHEQGGFSSLTRVEKPEDADKMRADYVLVLPKREQEETINFAIILEEPYDL